MPKSRRSRKAEAILGVASILFREQGFDRLTMDSVARAAGVSKATLYVHFKSKEALFVAVIEAETQWVNESIWPFGGRNKRSAKSYVKVERTKNGVWISSVRSCGLSSRSVSFDSLICPTRQRFRQMAAHRDGKWQSVSFSKSEIEGSFSTYQSMRTA